MKCFLQSCLPLWATLLMYSTYAQTPVLLKDIRPGFSNGISNYYTGVANGHYFFYGSTSAEGQELWATNGTASGTALLKDIYVGTGNGCGLYPLVVFKNKVWFGATADGGEYRLWSSDGSAAGTQVFTSTALSLSQGLVAAGENYLYYVANNAIGDPTIWRTDGTVAGTQAIATELDGTSVQFIESMVVAGDVLYFSWSGPKAAQLWKSNGTAAGTVLVKNIGTTPGNFNGDIQNLTAIGKKVYFAGDKNFNARFNPWVSDGTEAGTVELAEPFSFGNANPRWFYPFGQKVVFAATGTGSKGNLWITDGTKAGTTLLKEVIVAEFSNESVDFAVNTAGTRLFFAGKTSNEGKELWVSDGTPAGTLLLKDLDPGSFSGSPKSLLWANGRLYFQGNVDGNGSELCVSDGTNAGTKQLSNIEPGSGVNAEPQQIRQVGNTLVFIAYTLANGYEPYALGITSSLNTPRPNITLTLSPNPTNAPLRIVLPESAQWEAAQYRLFNALGQLVWQARPEGFVQDVVLPFLKEGIYWLEYAEKDGALGRTSVVIRQ